MDGIPKPKKQVRMANNVNNRKSGADCKEGLGRPIRPNTHESEKFAELYLKDYERKNAYGCDGYMMYDFQNGQYCCSARPRTPVEMIWFIFMMLEGVLDMANGVCHLRVIGYFFDIILRKVDDQMIKTRLQQQYDDYLRMINEQYTEFKKHREIPFCEEDQRIMEEFEEAERIKESRANANYEKQQKFLNSQKR
jgi:hypothetical protein